jgi:hypothetical protein
MTRRSVALRTGVVVAALYVAVAAVTGSRWMIARRPVFDGFGGPLPYNWVSPPPALASNNQPPASGSFTIDLDPNTGSEAAVYNTSDGQASLGVSNGAIPAQSGSGRAKLTITPLVPSGFGKPPGGLELAGNVYRFVAAYSPSGAAIATLHGPGQVVLTYPAPPNPVQYHHVLLFSADGKRWRRLSSLEAPATQQVQASSSELGYFAVGRSGTGTPVHRSWTSYLPWVITVALVLGALAIVGRYELGQRRARRSGGPAPKNPGRR